MSTRAWWRGVARATAAVCFAGAAIGIHLFMISNLEAEYYNKDYIYEVVVPDPPVM